MGSGGTAQQASLRMVLRLGAWGRGFLTRPRVWVPQCLLVLPVLVAWGRAGWLSIAGSELAGEQALRAAQRSISLAIAGTIVVRGALWYYRERVFTWRPFWVLASGFLEAMIVTSIYFGGAVDAPGPRELLAHRLEMFVLLVNWAAFVASQLRGTREVAA